MFLLVCIASNIKYNQCTGDRSKLKLLARDLGVNCLDAAGHTPLMYAAMGKQAKVTEWKMNRCCVKCYIGSFIFSWNTPLADTEE